MPPKKKKKLTKAQKAKLKQEEEERKLREQEEARLRAEQEERERLERERKEKELAALEKKYLECREDELNELHHLLETNHRAVTKWKTDIVETAKWDRYMRCDGTPDPAVHQDINTYMSVWRDDKEVDIQTVLKQCDLALKLIEELEVLVSDPQEGQKHLDELINLQELVHHKHLLTTEEILKRASANTDTETGNMQTVVKDDNITLCLWANLKKNPRFKGFTFEEMGLGFELPKQLAVSDVAIRILHTHYDHLSLLTRIAHPETHVANPSALLSLVEIPEEVEVPEQEETEQEGEEKEEGASQQQRQQQPQQQDEEVQESEGKESAASQSAASQSAASALLQDSSGQLVEGEQSQVVSQLEAMEAEAEAVPEAPLEPVVQEVNLMQYMPLGGIFYYDLYHLPPQALVVHGWEIRQMLDKVLQVFAYPFEKSDTDEESPPVRVCLKLPDCVVFFKTPEVARWDAADRQWRMDGITDISYEEEEATISFNVDSFQPFVLMQETYANFPIQSWELRPQGQDSVLFTIKAALIDFSIKVQGNQCMLLSDQERGLSHLKGKWMGSSALQRALVNAGVNIFVNEHTEKFVHSRGKDPLTEHAIYEQMALISTVCAFSWSKWNAKCGDEHLVIQACEHLSPDPVPEDSWNLYLMAAQKIFKLDIVESSKAFDSEYDPKRGFHSTLIHMLQETMRADSIARSRESTFLFVDTVQSLLCATRPLMYS